MFVATAEARDDDMKQRITRHRARRPAAWDTLEEPLDPVAAIPSALVDHDTLLLDCVTVWVSNLLLALGDENDAEAEILARAEALLDLYEQTDMRWILVSNEVGLGVDPGNGTGTPLPRPAGAGKPVVRRPRRQGVPDGRRPGPGLEVYRRPAVF